MDLFEHQKCYICQWKYCYSSEITVCNDTRATKIELYSNEVRCSSLIKFLQLWGFLTTADLEKDGNILPQTSPNRFGVEIKSCCLRKHQLTGFVGVSWSGEKWEHYISDITENYLVWRRKLWEFLTSGDLKKDGNIICQTLPKMIWCGDESYGNS